MSKQTALDWYWDKIKSHFEHDGDLFETATFTLAIAKQKEREQIENAYWEGGQDVPTHGRQCQQYYNETYKGSEQ